MAKTSGSNVTRTGGFSKNDVNYKGKVSNVSPLSSMKNNDVYREVKQGIARYHSVLGVREREIKLANLDSNVNGVQMTSGAGKSVGIYLNKGVYDLKKSQIEARTRKAYSSGWSTKTNKPIQHTITHELAHATWNQYLSAPNAKAAGKDINKLYGSWLKDKKKSGYGTYAKSNVNEFWAETVAKAVHGNSDKYTKRVKGIIKKYKL
ncbi:MAG: hypothetical protein AB2L20_11825 [Mangrovibacterium sp.]